MTLNLHCAFPEAGDLVGINWLSWTRTVFPVYLGLLYPIDIVESSSQDGQWIGPEVITCSILQNYMDR
jgi:hypothetical protein